MSSCLNQKKNKLSENKITLRYKNLKTIMCLYLPLSASLVNGVMSSYYRIFHNIIKKLRPSSSIGKRRMLCQIKSKVILVQMHK